MGLSADRSPAPDLSSLDPGGALRRTIAPERVIGGMIYSPNEMTAPGIVQHTSTRPSALTIGERDDSDSARIGELRAVLEGAGIKSEPTADIRHAIWSKLILNMTGSIVSLLTGRQVSVNRKDARLRDLYPRLTREALAIAAANGIGLDFDVEAQMERLPDHKPSIRQDYELGRPMEIESLLVVPLAFGAARGVDTPCLDTIAALAVLQAKDKGLYEA